MCWCAGVPVWRCGGVAVWRGWDMDLRCARLPPPPPTPCISLVDSPPPPLRPLMLAFLTNR